MSTTNVTGNVVGTPASNPFAGGPTTLTGGQAAVAASAAPGGTSTTANQTNVGAQAPCNGCGQHSIWQDIATAVIVAVIVAIIVKKL